MTSLGHDCGQRPACVNAIGTKPQPVNVANDDHDD